MQFQSLFSFLFLAAPLVHAVALPTDGFHINNNLGIRAGDTKEEANRLAREHTAACKNYRTCKKACETSSGYMTATGVLKEKAKKPAFEKCVKLSCDPINERADGLLRQWKTVDNAVKAKTCAA